jgi:hypothetical protein
MPGQNNRSGTHKPLHDASINLILIIWELRFSCQKLFRLWWARLRHRAVLYVVQYCGGTLSPPSGLKCVQQRTDSLTQPGCKNMVTQTYRVCCKPTGTIENVVTPWMGLLSCPLFPPAWAGLHCSAPSYLTYWQPFLATCLHKETNSLPYRLQAWRQRK